MGRKRIYSDAKRKERSKQANNRYRELHGKKLKDSAKEYRKLYPERTRKATNKYHWNNLRKCHAHALLHHAIKTGKIKRPNKCSNCNKKCKPEGHHKDYDKPLEVVWLCFQCHKNI